LLNKLHKVFICSPQLGAAVARYVNVHEAKCTLLTVRYLLLF